MKNGTKFAIVLAIGLFLPTAKLAAEVKLPAIFSDHMVLQQQEKVAVWGWAEPGEQVSVAIGKANASAKAGKDGKWMATLPRLSVSKTPLTLTVSGAKNKILVHDVLVGEVWIGSGQSNMAMSVERSNDAEKEIAAAKYPQIRLFTVPRNPSREPLSDCQGKWVVCSPETVGPFSGVLYFFGRALHQELKVPVGLINSSYGGTDIAAWTSWPAQKDVAEMRPVFEMWDQRAETFDLAKAKMAYEKGLAKWKARIQEARKKGLAGVAAIKFAGRRPLPPVNPRDDRNHPARLFNGMIAPLIPYTIRGVVWYQGEHNTRDSEWGYRYRTQLPLLIEDWRSRWGLGDFPFAWAQLPNFTRKGDGWMLVREAMLLSLKVPNTGMAVTIDIGDPKDIHPKNKQDVGKRLSYWALGTVYGKKTATSGPLPEGHKIKGREVVLNFTHTDGGLKAKGKELQGFVIAGKDKQWHPANARIEGDQVIVSHPDVAQPVAVRYAWADNPVCNLYNGAGIPASPFRTDAWKE